MNFKILDLKGFFDTSWQTWVKYLISFNMLWNSTYIKAPHFV